MGAANRTLMGHVRVGRDERVLRPRRGCLGAAVDVRGVASTYVAIGDISLDVQTVVSELVTNALRARVPSPHGVPGCSPQLCADRGERRRLRRPGHAAAQPGRRARSRPVDRGRIVEALGSRAWKAGQDCLGRDCPDRRCRSELRLRRLIAQSPSSAEASAIRLGPAQYVCQGVPRPTE